MNFEELVKGQSICIKDVKEIQKPFTIFIKEIQNENDITVEKVKPHFPDEKIFDKDNNEIDLKKEFKINLDWLNDENKSIFIL